MSKRRFLQPLVRSFKALEQERQAFNRRTENLEEEYGSSEETDLFDRIGDNLYDQEEQVENMMKDAVKQEPIWKGYLKYVNGIGPKTAARIVGGSIDPAKAEYPSSFEKYCCLHVVDGKAYQFSHGEQADCNPDYKSLMLYIVGKNLQRSNEFYYHRYRIYKQEEKKKVTKMVEDGEKDLNEEEQEGYAGKRARRKMVKLFVDHLWEAWRKVEGLPSARPYHVEHVEGENHYIPPQVQVDGETIDWENL